MIIERLQQYLKMVIMPRQKYFHTRFHISNFDDTQETMENFKLKK